MCCNNNLAVWFTLAKFNPKTTPNWSSTCSSTIIVWRPFTIFFFLVVFFNNFQSAFLFSYFLSFLFLKALLASHPCWLQGPMTQGLITKKCLVVKDLKLPLHHKLMAQPLRGFRKNILFGSLRLRQSPRISVCDSTSQTDGTTITWL